MGKLISKTYGNGVTETISYNIQGWQTGIAVKNGNNNIYSQQLKYYNPTKGSTPLYTGNISEWSTTMGAQTMNTYGFEYDKFRRLKNTNNYIGTATTPTAAFTERGITYDKNGNIQTLQRYAQNTASPEDSYMYSYQGNKLASINGTDNGATISGATYTYDSNGNMRSDGLKNLQISYNFLNLPSVVTQDGIPVAEYSWFADGSKYRVLTQQNNGYIYTGSLIYASNNGNLQIESTDFAGGRINLVENTLTNTLSQDIQYHHTDHLGSVRAITNQNGETVEQNAYYPFGSRHTFGNTYAQTTNRFKFNGKEEQTTGNLNYLDYGARMYDANIGRWFVQDPLAEENISFSSYNYVSNNPISRIDYKGLLDDWVENKNGVIYWDEYAYSPETTEEGYVYLGPIVVVFNGSTDETLGTKTDSKHLNGYLDGTDAETAEVIVYGPNGEQDIQFYTGFTMTSDFDKFGAIADGNYDVSYKVPGKSGKIPSNYAINNGGPVDCINGVNPSPKEYNPYSPTQKDGIYIHRTNLDGWAGGSISTGCLLILGSQWAQFEQQIGNNNFKLKLIRK